jgi:hypothetical protein
MVKHAADIVLLLKPGIQLDLILETPKLCCCYNAKDRVYAILNLLPPVFRCLITPDYTLDIYDVYKNFFLGYIKAFDTEPLLKIPMIHKSTTLAYKIAPSWIPDLNSPCRAFEVSNATGSSPHEITCSNTNESLQMSGVKVAEVC